MGFKPITSRVLLRRRVLYRCATTAALIILFSFTASCPSPIIFHFLAFLCSKKKKFDEENFCFPFFLFWPPLSPTSNYDYPINFWWVEKKTGQVGPKSFFSEFLKTTWVSKEHSTSTATTTTLAATTTTTTSAAAATTRKFTRPVIRLKVAFKMSAWSWWQRWPAFKWLWRSRQLSYHVSWPWILIQFPYLTHSLSLLIVNSFISRAKVATKW